MKEIKEKEDEKKRTASSILKSKSYEKYKDILKVLLVKENYNEKEVKNLLQGFLQREVK